MVAHTKSAFLIIYSSPPPLRAPDCEFFGAQRTALLFRGAFGARELIGQSNAFGLAIPHLAAQTRALLFGGRQTLGGALSGGAIHAQLLVGVREFALTLREPGERAGTQWGRSNFLTRQERACESALSRE